MRNDAAPAGDPAEGRVALVSVGTRGLGLQIVRRLAGRGMRVVLGSRSVERGRLAIDALGPLADSVAVRHLDVMDPASVERLGWWLDSRLGRCDVLINNATILMDDDRDATVVDLDVVRRALETNLLGTWRLTQAVAPLMRAQHYGRVVTVSPGHLAPQRNGPAAHHVSATAIASLTTMLSAELAGDGILVNACCPRPADSATRTGSGALTGAETPVWLATLPDDGLTGQLYCCPRPPLR